MAKCILAFSLHSCKRLLGKEASLSVAQCRQKKTGGHDGNLDISQWDGEKFVTSKSHRETQQYPGLYNGEPQPKGRVYDKKPFRMDVEKGKVYLWCSCGLSKSQPFCDKTHLYEEGTSRLKTKPRIRPVKYIAKENKTVYFCNCKQTNNAPFCDNSHRQPDVENATSIFRN